jgi:hypothetical protein
VPRPEPELFQLIIQRTREYTKQVVSDYQINEVSDRALHDLVGACVENHIPVALVMLPDHSAFRACVPPPVEAHATAYLVRLGRELGLPIVDVRDWVADEDFLDLSHCLPRAAGPFTARFGREVLYPLLQGRRLSADVLLHEPHSSPAGPTASP